MTSPLNIALLFTVIFAALKIAGVTAMTWLGVFSPILIWLGIVSILAIYFACRSGSRSRSRYDRFW